MDAGSRHLSAEPLVLLRGRCQSTSCGSVVWIPWARLRTGCCNQGLPDPELRPPKQVRSQMDGEETAPLIVSGNLSPSGRVLWEYSLFFGKLSEEIVVLAIVSLHSLVCKMYVVLLWCHSSYRDKGKVFI